ncbi:MAG: UDP-N-acetylglucosamine--N-acetylmuramyl-(pentapeptide) pyrophosphoryl-undecaprenol N-acetylglucosamine transferase, partial [Kiritimatiellae bacterium]|nr:UDP-N-acetylglucosamine--N-acetylmuramyl-(pentapeptide) pyrophosphoryl-undecaprenol N-acetylglucosamine transferase [Kiritimatiellia bacterium]
MKAAIACGGTGGHIFPGMATASALKARGHEVVLWLAGKDVEQAAVAGWDGPVVTVKAEGFPAGFSLRAVRVAWKLLLAIAACRRAMKRDRPDVLLAMGSYASVGPTGAAMLLRVPVVLHESNVLPGRAIRMLARRADAVAASFEHTRFYLKRKDLVVTGMPLRKELEGGGKEASFQGLDRGRFSLLVMGGSRGATRLNEVASEALCELHRQGYEFQVVHLTGAPDEDAVRSRYAEAGVPHMVRAFLADMSGVFSMVDFAVCRSGAATCAELSAFGVPALLVPYPFATNDHQTYNARALEKLGAADVVAERDLTVPWLTDYISQC